MTKDLKIVAIPSVIVLLVIILMSQTGIIEVKIANSLIFAIIFNLFNFLIAIYLLNFSLKKSNTTFLLATLGGMGLRLLLMLALVLIAILFLNIDKYAFIFGFFIIYFISLIYEIYLIRNKADKRKV